MTPLSWESEELALTFVLDQGPVRIESVRLRSRPDVPLSMSRGRPLVEVSALGHGRSPASLQHVDTVIGRRLRHVTHGTEGAELRIVQEDPETGLRAISCFRALSGVQTWTELILTRPGELDIDFCSSVVVGLASVDVDLLAGRNAWMAEGRWSAQPLRSTTLADIRLAPHFPPPRHRHAVTNHGSWSSAEHLPTGLLLWSDGAIGWQIEHNGLWHYEVGETRDGGYLLLSGPTDQEHGWTTTVTAEKAFRTVPVSLVAAADRDGAFAALTRHRRSLRPVRPIENRLPVIFNDYMNTLMGDPTTERLQPLIEAAAEVGVDYFTIDAGWYADGDWWSTVGQWQPSATRFPGGLEEVADRIRAHRMTPGLWLEPEVIGVRSPLARSLPDDAFLRRHGVRITEQGRHLLDLRSEAARRHLDDTVDGLVKRFGIGYLKLDNNTMTGPGPGHREDGETGLLGHQRALLAWLDAVQARHPSLLLENCASGAMRMDYAMLQRMHLQSTSDQQHHLLYATIAAAAPASVLPEQAGNWAYPHVGMSPEEIVFSLVNGMLGRLYLSGYLNRMSTAQLDLVRSAVAAHRELLDELPQLVPFWPLGLPAWSDEWTALGLEGSRSRYLAIWHRGMEPAEVILPLPRGQVEPFYPAALAGWTYSWTREGLVAMAGLDEPSARVIRIHT